MTNKICPPEKLNNSHHFDDFESGNPLLDNWLKQKALGNELSGASRTYVVCVEQRVVGYYCLANGAVTHQSAPRKIKRNMPDPIPVMLIGRLAVDLRWQNKGIGKGLLKDTILRTLAVAEIAGIRAIMVHAISPEAKTFYERFGFMPSPQEPMLLMLKINDLITSL